LHEVITLCEDRGQSLSSACAANAALKQEHIDASGTGSGGSCAARRDIGNSVRLTQALQAQHRSTSPFDAAMVLLKSVVEVATHSMSHLPAELDPDRSGIGVMAVCGDPCRCDASNRLGRWCRAWPVSVLGGGGNSERRLVWRGGV